jgi:hypothetical protein
VRSSEDGGASSSVTDEKRETLRECVRGMMRGGEMSSEPETLDHRQAVPKGMAQQWEDSIDKTRGIGVEEEELTARHELHDMDAPDDFFEDNTGNEDSEAYEPANTRSELPAKRRPDKAGNRSDRPTEKDPKKVKHKKKHRTVAPPATIHDSFFGDESE